MRCAFLFLPTSWVVATAHPQWVSDPDTGVRDFPPDDAGNVIIPDDPTSFFIDKGTEGPSFPIDAWPVATDDNLFLNLDNVEPLEYSLINYDPGLVPIPEYPYAVVNYCPSGLGTLCSSVDPDDTISAVGLGELVFTVRNGEQSMF